MKSPNTDLRSLQILRMIAATSVVYYHIYAKPNFGLFGVDIFFVLSGFVIALVLKNNSTAKQFAINRISRIVPIYWILTTFLFLLIYIYPPIVRKSTAETATIFLYLKSLFFIPYYGIQEVKPPLLRVGWTLNYEIFFYFITWTALVIFKKQFFKCIFLLMFCTYTAPLVLSSENPFFQEFFSSYYIFEFLLGICVFHIYTVRHSLIKSSLCPYI